MKSIQKIEAGKIYVFRSSASANSTYFETKQTVRLFFQYANYYLKDYLTIHEYKVDQDGWTMIIKIKSAQTIRKNYKQYLQNKQRKTPESISIWRIVSERIRLFISTYVRLSNQKLGREGSLVRRKYERYQFDSQEEASTYIKNIHTKQSSHQQPLKKYQGVKKHYRIKTRDHKNTLLVSSRMVPQLKKMGKLKEEMRRVFGGNISVVKGFTDLVGLNFLINYRNQTPSPKPPQKSP